MSIHSVIHPPAPLVASLRRAAPGAVVVASVLLAAPGTPVLASDVVERPGPPPGTATFSPPADSIRIPFEMFRGEIRLTARVQGKEARMLVDNGALWDELLFFGSPRVDALKLPSVGKAQVGGAGTGPPVEADYAEGIHLRFDGEDGQVVEFGEQTAITLPYEPGAPNPWEGSEGQVSSVLFKRFVVVFDFDEGVMTLIQPDKFDPTGRGTEIPIRPAVDSGSWTLPAAITLHDGRRLELDMTMDLGWDEPVAINAGQGHDIRVPEGLPKTLLGLGAQGEIWGHHGTVPALEIGGHRFRDVSATYSTLEDGGSKADEIMVGLGIFERFHVAFDYTRHRLFVEPNERFRDPFEVRAARP